MTVRELIDGCEVGQALLVRDIDARAPEHNSVPLRLSLGDRTGTVTAILMENVAEAVAICRPGEVVHVSGRFSHHRRFGGQIAVTALRIADPSEYDPRELLDGPAQPIERMEADLRALLSTIQNPHLRRLLALVFGEGSPAWAAFRDAPAAKHYHQAYRHGLLEHCLTVAQAVSATSAIFPGIDRDVAVTGALLHDIGKLEAYDVAGGTISMSDRGRLQGEIAMGYYRVRRAIERLDGFPPELAEAIQHIILSHHGSLEHGSPVVPATREATLVHMMDNVGGKLGSFDRVERELPAGERWTAYDKAIGGGAFFPAREKARREAA